MNTNKRTGVVIAVFIIGVLFTVIVSMAIENAGDVITVKGIVEYASNDVLVIKKKEHNITGAPILSIDGETIAKIQDSIRGRMAVIKYDKGKLACVIIFPSVQ